MVVYMVKTPDWPVDLFRALLDRILDETGMSQAQLAALVPMDQSQLSRWKSGKSRPKFESLTALGDALRQRHPGLGIGPDALVTSAGYATDLPETTAPVSVTEDASEAEQLGLKAIQDLLIAQSREIAELRKEVRRLATQRDADTTSDDSQNTA